MTKPSEFTEEEWRCIVSGPPMVGVAVAAASPSGPIGMMKEMLALGMALGQVAERGSFNALITAVVKDLKERTTASQAPPEVLSAQGRSGMRPRAREEQLLGAAVDRVATVNLETEDALQISAAAGAPSLTDSKAKIIAFAWVNDEQTLRSSGSKSDPYAVLQKMLDRGNPPAPAFGRHEIRVDFVWVKIFYNDDESIG